MKLRYPAEAFALGIILFSTGMKEAFAAGILVILTAVFAEFLKDLLENAVPAWSLTLCVLIASGIFCASACQIGFAYLGLPLSVGTWLMSLIVGLLCARHALSDNIENEYGELFFESAVAWGFWISPRDHTGIHGRRNDLWQSGIPKSDPVQNLSGKYFCIFDRRTCAGIYERFFEEKLPWFQ